MSAVEKDVTQLRPLPSTTAWDKSLTLGKLAEALSKAQAAMRHASKDATNPHFRSRYADLASVIEACREPLAAQGLSVLQPVTADGKRVTVTTLLAHSSGEWVSCSLTMTARDDGPQAVGSVVTYGRRYGLASLVGVAADDDGGEAGEGRGGPQAVKSPPKAQAKRPPASVHGDDDLPRDFGADGKPAPGWSGGPVQPRSETPQKSVRGSIDTSAELPDGMTAGPTDKSRDMREGIEADVVTLRDEKARETVRRKLAEAGHDLTKLAKLSVWLTGKLEAEQAPREPGAEG